MATDAFLATMRGHGFSPDQIEFLSMSPGSGEPVGAYAAITLPPAARKSPAFAALAKPIRGWEAEEGKRAAPLLLPVRDAVEVAEKRIEAGKRHAAQAMPDREEGEPR